MTAPALALSFFDAAHNIHGTARSGLTILFEDRKPNAIPEGPQIEATGSGWRAELPEKLSLELQPVSPPADFGGVRARVARVRGEAGGRTVDGIGTLSESSTRYAASRRWSTTSTRSWHSRSGRAAPSATATSR